MVRSIQREALGKVLQQGGIGRLGVTNHRLVWFKGNVDCRDRVLLRVGRFGSERHGNIVGEARQRPQIFQAWNCLVQWV
jgi:hypothetical protein